MSDAVSQSTDDEREEMTVDDIYAALAAEYRAIARGLTREQRRFLTARTDRTVAISGDGWDGLVRGRLIEDDMLAVKLTDLGRAVAEAINAE